jgi:hypothetical protein
MSAEALAAPPAAPFASQHPADRNFFLALLLFTWAGIIGGFGLDMLNHIRHSTRVYPLIVHLHAFVFVTWMVLLTSQMLLVRGSRLDLHRRLGMAAAWLIPVMVVVALATVWTVQRQAAALGVHHQHFLAINLTDILGFATLAGAGLWLRRDSSAHKRLMLISTFYLSTAGFARLWLLTIGTAGTEDSFWGFFVAYDLSGDIALIALGIYDLITRGRLHPAYVLGAGWVLANELAAAGLYFTPAWKPVAAKLLGLA